MITVISRFRVANDKTEAVARAFRERPHLVENAIGFQGIEVLRDTNDSAIFYLYTKWDDLHSYQEWHSSAAHLASHDRIPKGLKLDAAFTRIEILHDQSRTVSENHENFLDSFLSESDQSFYFRLNRKGEVESCSPSFLRAVKLSNKEICGKNVTDFLVEHDAVLLKDTLKSLVGTQDMILNFVDSALFPISVKARMSAVNEKILLIAERSSIEEESLARQLIDLNNELTRLTREIQQKNRELTETRDGLVRAIEERDKSHWFIRRMQDVLPICMGCKKVKPSESSWQDVEEFLKNNTDFLTHSYCPDCLEKWKKGNL